MKFNIYAVKSVKCLISLFHFKMFDKAMVKYMTS